MTKEETLLIRNLKDSGCDKETVEKFLNLSKEEKSEQQKKLLSLQRKHLLEQIHKIQEQIDCLDFLLYSMNKTGG